MNVQIYTTSSSKEIIRFNLYLQFNFVIVTHPYYFIEHYEISRQYRKKERFKNRI